MRSLVIAVAAALVFASGAAAQGPYHLDPATHHCVGVSGKPAPLKFCVHPTAPICANGTVCGKKCLPKGQACHPPG